MEPWSTQDDAPYRNRILSLFDSHVDRSGDCHVWTAFRDPKGYGRFTLRAEWAASGSRNGSAKLTDEQRAEIRARRATGETLRALATAYGVSHPAIRKVSQ